MYIVKYILIWKLINMSVRKTVLLIAPVASFFTAFMFSSLNLALPAIQKDFSTDAVLLSWIATSYLLATAVFLVPVGKIADIYGHTRIFFSGIIIFTVFTFACAFAPTIYLLILMRVLQGIGAAMIATTSTSLLTLVFPPQERGKAIGLNVSCVYIGLSLGPFIGGFLIQYLGWHSIFLFVIPFGLFVAIIAFRFLRGLPKPVPASEPEKLDITGSIIYALTLVAFIYGSSHLPQISGFILMLLGIPCLILFVRRQLRITNPVFEIRLYKNNRVFAFSNVAALINYAGTNAVTFFLSLYLQYIKGLSPQQAGLLLVIQPLTQAVLSPLAGRISDKKEPAILSSSGMALSAVGLFMFIFLNENTSEIFIAVALLILGLGFALFAAPNTNAIMSSVEKKYYGIASASVSVMRLLGQMLSLAIATVFISIFVGKNQISPEFYPMFLQSVKFSFIIFTVLCAGGIFFSYSRGKVHD